MTPYEAFLVSVESLKFAFLRASHHASALMICGFAYRSAYTLGPEPSPGLNYPPASPLRSNVIKKVPEY